MSLMLERHNNSFYILHQVSISSTDTTMDGTRLRMLGVEEAFSASDPSCDFVSEASFVFKARKLTTSLRLTFVDFSCSNSKFIGTAVGNGFSLVKNVAFCVSNWKITSFGLNQLTFSLRMGTMKHNIEFIVCRLKQYCASSVLLKN